MEVQCQLKPDPMPTNVMMFLAWRGHLDKCPYMAGRELHGDQSPVVPVWMTKVTFPWFYFVLSPTVGIGEGQDSFPGHCVGGNVSEAWTFLW